MNDSFQRKSGIIFSYISIIINTLIQLLYTPILIRSLGQSEYGLYSLVASIIGYLNVMELSFGNAIVVYTSKYRIQKKINEEKKLQGMFNLIFKIMGIIAFSFGIILYFNVDNMFGLKMTLDEIEKMKIMMIILSFNLLFTFSFSIYNSIITAYEKFTFQKIVSIIHSLLTPIMMIPLLLLGHKSIALCVVITISNLLALLSNYIYCRKKLSITVNFLGFDKKIFKIILKYSLWIFLGVIVDKVNWSLDNFILGAVSGTMAVSIYSIASTINQMFCSLSTAISSVFLPKMSKMIAKNISSKDLTEEMIKVGRIQNYVIFLICSGFILLGKNFITLWAGDGFLESYYVTLLLIIPVSIPLIQNLGLSIMQAMNKYKFKAVTTFIMSLFNVIISVFLAKKFGAIGAALGTCISLVVCNIFIINIYYHRVIKLNIIKFWKNIFMQSIPFIIPIAIIMTIMHFTSLKGLSNFLVYGSIYSIMFCVTAYYLSMNEYEKKIVNKLLIKIRLKRR